MNNEFKKISKDDTTRYILESASGGGTSAGSIATAPKSMGGVQRRDNLLVQDTSQKLTPRSPVAHAAQKVAKGSGKHTDRKQQSKQVRGEKHKTKDFAENQDHEISMAGSELHSIFQNAKQLHSMIKTKSEEEGLDAWQQSKITKAADYLNSVLQSLQHEMMGEGWSQKYKNSINCSHPKGFSQRAHCAGKRKHNESVEMEMTCPDCGMCETHGDNMMEVKQRLDAKCWKGKHKEGTKIKGGIRVNNCVAEGLEQEGSTFKNSLHTIIRVATHLERQMSDDENFPEWESEMIGSVKDQMVKIMDYEISKKEQGVAEGGPFSYGKPPRKGSVADLAAKRRKEQDRKTPPIEPKDQMVGNAKVTKDTKEGLKQMLRKVDPTIKSRLRSKADRLDDEGDEVHQDLKSMGMEPHDSMTRNMDPEKYYRNADRYRRLADKDVGEAQLAELDRPSGKLFIIVKADNAGATHVFGDFGSFPQDVMHKVSKRGTRDKSGAKTKLKIDFLFNDFRSTIQQLRTIFRDVDFVGAEAAEFIIHSSALKSDQGEDVKHLRDYIEAGDDRRMKIYQAPEDDEEDDGETTGGNILRIDPETGAARKVVGVKPQTQMGGKSAEQPGMTTYKFKDPGFARQLRGMNLGFNIKNDSITVDQKQKQELLRKLGNKFGDIFTSQEKFKEEDAVEAMLPKSSFAGSNKNKLGPAAHLKGSMKRPARAGDLVGGDAQESRELSEKAVSQQQQKFFGMVHAMQKGKKIPGASAELKKTAKDMSKSDAKDFAKTKHAGLPKKVSEKMELPPTGMNPEDAQKFAADQMAKQQALYKQPSQKTGSDRDLGNGFTLTTTNYDGQNYPSILDTQDKIYWLEPTENIHTLGFGSHIKIQNGKAINGIPGPATKAAMKAAGWAVSASAPARPTEPDQSGPIVPRDYETKEPLKKGPDGKWYNSKGEERDGFHGGPINPDTGSAMFRGLKPKSAPTNEDSYMESLSAALEQKLSVNDTPEVWRDDFVNADPVKFKQFRNKTDEKKRHMADVARYRRIQKK